MNDQQPYLEETIAVLKYNPEYGDDRICVCGHPYYRHFDTYDDMFPIGCKHCECEKFVQSEVLDKFDENYKKYKI